MHLAKLDRIPDFQPSAPPQPRIGAAEMGGLQSATALARLSSPLPPPPLSQVR